MKKKKVNKKNAGFSLVELIIVIAIMAILVGVLAPQYLGHVEKTKQATDIHNAEELAKEIGVRMAELETEGTLPDELDLMQWYQVVSKSNTTSKAHIKVDTVPGLKKLKGGNFYYKVEKGQVVIAIVPKGITKADPEYEVYPKFGTKSIVTYNKISN
ncbi:MAG: type II secretion system protein [Lachnospiraceae bacterium]